MTDLCSYFDGSVGFKCPPTCFCCSEVTCCFWLTPLLYLMLITHENLILCFCCQMYCWGEWPSHQAQVMCMIFLPFFLPPQLSSESLCLISSESDCSRWSFMALGTYWGHSCCGSRYLLAFLVAVLLALQKEKLYYLGGWNLRSTELRSPVGSEVRILTSFDFWNYIIFWRLSTMAMWLKSILQELVWL